MSVVVMDVWHEKVSAMLRGNFIPPYEVADQFGSYTTADLEAYEATLPGRQRLVAYQCQNMLLIPGPPQVAVIEELLHQGRSVAIPCEKMAAYVQRERVPKRWIAIMRHPHERTVAKPWAWQQRELASAGLAAPTAAEILWVSAVMSKVRRERFIGTQRTRTASSVQKGQQIECRSEQGRCVMSSFWSHLRQYDLGVIGVHRWEQ